jgi:micrococcal nuclease
MFMANPRELFGRALYGTGRRRVRALPFWPVVVAAAVIGGLATMSLQQTGLNAFLLEAMPGAVAASAEQQDFGLCAGGRRITCVVDGDTFWLDGVKIRIADINTPEVGSPQCANEAELGRQAASRLTQLLSAGPFELDRVDRDADQYGRKLRIVSRNGQSLGDVLVGEGLAHAWRGQRESWC